MLLKSKNGTVFPNFVFCNTMIQKLRKALDENTVTPLLNQIF